ncbi:hypothetical protein FSY59_16655 [Comamonas sp. Z3]|uniref:hypothetical protein n=1 Tax=Comamonas sp. Z3 TaxID=2601247 RepID=UPI0011E76D60|nr:hypothetical protein [Comamonas sp. Z3]TYK69942.1 hypothetical protein FSY59_16655 [Comamonas sp. Z3]
MSKFLRLLVLVLLPFFAGGAHASWPADYGVTYGASMDRQFPTAQQACDDTWKTEQTKAVSYSYKTWACFYKDGNGNDLLRVLVYEFFGYLCTAPNSSLAGDQCGCNPGYEQDGKSCKKVNSCRFGNTSSAGYFDAGKNTDGGPAIMACVGGCETVFDGEFPAGNALVGGVKHYYAKGEYIQTGKECSGSAAEVGQGIPVTEIPPDTCGEGQVAGKVKGKTVCAKGADADTAASKPDDKKDQTSTTKTTTKDKDSEGNDRETTTTVKKNADGSTTTETTVTVTKGDGKGGTTSTTTTNTVTNGGVGGSGGKGESGGKEDGEEDGDKEKGKCEKNSSDEGCGGAAANVDGKTFYTAKEKTFAGVLSKASTDLRGSGIGGAFTGFFNVASGGACPVSNWHIPYINADLTFDFMCQPFALDAMLIIKGVLLVIASFMAFRIAFE